MVRQKMTWKVLIPEKLDNSAIELLKGDTNFEPIILESPDLATLKQSLQSCDGLIVRSKTKVNKELLEASGNLKVIGRAGVGTDNIDLIAAEKKGVLVVNAPEESLDSVADLTIGLILSLCRRLHIAFERTRQGNFQRNDLLGCELRGLVLGLVGCGRIGRKVAQRAKAFGIKVVGFDPFISPKLLEAEGIERISLNNLLKSADIVSLHLPLTESTRNLISASELNLMKKTAYFINTSRADIVDSKALLEAIQEGRIAGAGLDVVKTKDPNSPLLKHPNVLVSPHLGASTVGAQKNVGLIIVQEVMSVLKGKPSRYPVNFPKLPPNAQELYIPYRDLISRMATVLLPLTKTSFNKITISYPKGLPTPLISILTRSFLAIFLKSIVSGDINIINSQKIAEERDIEIVESILSDKKYQNTVNAKISMNKEIVNSISAQITPGQRLLLIKINNYDIKFELTGYLFLIDFMDRPGMIGSICSFLGENSINIAELQVARLLKLKTQLMTLKTDQDVPQEITKNLQKLKDINGVYYYSFNP